MRWDVAALQVETAGERVPLRNARVRDMSGVCRWVVHLAVDRCHSIGLWQHRAPCVHISSLTYACW